MKLSSLFNRTRPKSGPGVVPPCLPPEQTAYFSPYGGFWTDLRNGEQVLAGKRDLGWLSEDEARLLKFWIDNGFAILKGAVSPSLVDAVRHDITQVVEYEHSLSKVSYWKDGVKYFETASEERMAQVEAKLLDMHMLSEAVRQAIYAPDILRFLKLVFERRPSAFQSLTFEYGSQQPIHCDVAFVRVSSPREFVASWIALEDIEEGTGELEYFPGSHHLPDLLFEGTTPWACGDISDYHERLAGEARRNSLALQRFLPDKGDVLIWNAGLYHGGSRCTGERRTRKSLVTHYCPSDRFPMDGEDGSRPVFETPYGGDVSGGYPSQLHTV